MQGCTYVVQSFMEYSVNRSKVIWSLVEAIGEYLNIITFSMIYGFIFYFFFIVFDLRTMKRTFVLLEIFFNVKTEQTRRKPREKFFSLYGQEI